MITPESVAMAFDRGLAVGLIVVGIAFLILAVWPWWTKRDELERERRHNVALKEIEQHAMLVGPVRDISDRMKPPIMVQLVSNDKT